MNEDFREVLGKLNSKSQQQAGLEALCSIIEQQAALMEQKAIH